METMAIKEIAKCMLFIYFFKLLRLTFFGENDQDFAMEKILLCKTSDD